MINVETKDGKIAIKCGDATGAELICEVRYNVMGWDIEDALFTPRYQKPISGKEYKTA